MTITTKWNKLLDWRCADITATDVLKCIKTPATCFLSADAFGLKGKIPGGKHTWITTYNGNRWTTFEISDRETIEIQSANIIYAKEDNYTQRQLIVSDREPSTMWFGNIPRLDFISPLIDIEYWQYPLNKNINLRFNNCSTFLSYVAWKYRLDFKRNYIGFKSKQFWEHYEG